MTPYNAHGFGRVARSMLRVSCHRALAQGSGHSSARASTSSCLYLIFVGQVGRVEISLVGVEIFQIEKQALVMDEVRASMPRADVKLDQAIARNSKRRNPVEFRSGAVGKIVWWSAPDEPFLALHRPEALADAPMTRHVGEYKSPFLQVHNPQSRRAIREGQFGLFDAGFSARCARPDDFTIWRKLLWLQILSGELNHGVCGHGHPPFCALRGSLSPQTSHGNIGKRRMPLCRFQS
jgi:hypothetical protein